MRVCKYCKQEWKSGREKCPHCGSVSFLDIEEEENLTKSNFHFDNTTNEMNEKIKKRRIMLLAIGFLILCLIAIGVSKIKSSLEEKKAFEAEMTANYEHGMAYYENGDYVSAIKMLRKVDESFNSYPEASSVLSEIEDTYKKNTLNEVESMVEQEQYVEASEKIVILQELFPEDANIVVKAQSVQKQAVLKSVDEFMQVENYQEIISLIDNSDEMIKNSSEVRTKYEEAKLYYLNYIQRKAEEAYNDGGVASALSVINEGLDILQDNNELLGLIEEYNEKIPTDLFEMEEFIGEMEDNLYLAEDEGDNSGVQGYKYKAIIPGLCDPVTYLLGRNYKLLQFKIGLAGSRNDTIKHAWIEIYGDGKKMFESTHFTAGVRPEEYKIDISSIDELQIVFKDTGHTTTLTGGDAASLLLSEFWVSK